MWMGGRWYHALMVIHEIYDIDVYFRDSTWRESKGFKGR
jgi:hypothetical protein